MDQMEKSQNEMIACTACGFIWSKADQDRECSNCFACTGCEIYLCPGCRKEIVIKPIGEPAFRRFKQTES